MKRKLDRALGFAAALLLGNVGCSVANDLGRDLEGNGGTTGGSYVEAYGLSGDPTLGQLAVATGSSTPQVTLLAGQDGAPLHVLKPSSPSAGSLRVLQANGVVALSNPGTAWIFNADGTSVGTIASGYPGALSADGKVLLSAGADGLVHRFDVATGAELTPSFQPPPVDGGAEPITAVAISPDGAYAAGRDSRAVYLWRAVDGVQVAQVGSGSVALSASELVVSDSVAVTVYSLTGETLAQYPAPGYLQGQLLAFSTDGTKLAFTASVGDHLPIKIIDRTSGAELVTVYDDQQASKQPNGKAVLKIGLAFIDGALAIAWSDRRVSLFGTENGAKLWSRIVDE